MTDVNEPPYPPVLDKNIVPENGRAVAVVGRFSTADPERNKVALAMAKMMDIGQRVLLPEGDNSVL